MDLPNLFIVRPESQGGGRDCYFWSFCEFVFGPTLARIASGACFDGRRDAKQLGADISTSQCGTV